jgi:hypothetical protein
MSFLWTLSKHLMPSNQPGVAGMMKGKKIMYIIFLHNTDYFRIRYTVYVIVLYLFEF